MLMPIIVPSDFVALCIDQINEGQGLTGIILEQFSLATFYYLQLSTNYKQGTVAFLNNDYLWGKKKYLSIWMPERVCPRVCIGNNIQTVMTRRLCLSYIQSAPKTKLFM